MKDNKDKLRRAIEHLPLANRERDLAIAIDRMPAAEVDAILKDLNRLRELLRPRTAP